MSDTSRRIEGVLANQDAAMDPDKEEGVQPDPHPDRTKMFVTAGFQRFSIKWSPEDAEVIGQLKAFSDDMIREEFADAFAIIEKLYREVRRQAYDTGTGEFLTEDDGTPVWITDEDGIPEEHWVELSDRTRIWAMFAINTRLVLWSMRSADEWAQSMFAKVEWEQAFAHGFTALPDVSISGKPTIDDRTQWGQRISVEQRYFALFRTYISKKADALVRSMEKLYYLLDKTSQK